MLFRSSNSMVFSATGGVTLSDGSSNDYGAPTIDCDGVDGFIRSVSEPQWGLFDTYSSVWTVYARVVWTIAAPSVWTVILQHFEDSQNYWSLSRTQTNQIVLWRVSGGSTTISTYSPASAIAQDVWYDISIVVDGTEVGVFIDEDLVIFDDSWTAGAVDGEMDLGDNPQGTSPAAIRYGEVVVAQQNLFNAVLTGSPTITIPDALKQVIME